MAGFIATLDACVLVPITLADTLLRVAERELYRPVWSERILAETMDAICAVHPEADPDAIRRRISDMNTTFEDACIEGWESIEINIILPDPDDRHVVAAAVCGRAGVIVTSNLKDFPAAVLKPFGLEVLSPDDFLLDALDLAPRIVLDVIREQAAHSRRPVLSPVDVVARLARAGVPQFADEIGRLI